MLRDQGAHFFFSLPLALPVNAQRSRRMIYTVRLEYLSVEDVVGRDMDQVRPELPADGGQVGRSLAIDGKRELRFTLGPLSARSTAV